MNTSKPIIISSGLNLRNIAFALIFPLVLNIVGLDLLDWKFWFVLIPVSMLYWWGRQEAP